MIWRGGSLLIWTTGAMCMVESHCRHCDCGNMSAMEPRLVHSSQSQVAEGEKRVGCEMSGRISVFLAAGEFSSA